MSANPKPDGSAGRPVPQPPGVTRTGRGAPSRCFAPLVAAAALALPAPATAQAPAATGLRPRLWISTPEPRRLPERGPAWRRLEQIARREPGHPDLSNKDEEDDPNALAARPPPARRAA